MTRANLCVLLSTSFFALVAVGGQALWLIQQAGHVGGALLLACYFLLASLSYVALVKAMWTSPGRLADLKASAISVQEEPAQTCDKCAAWKPERGHHCSTCGECTLKMDHHCHWISSCVGFRNYKFFFLFVVYGTLTQVFTEVLLIFALVTKAPAGFEAWDYAAMACLCLVGPMSIFSVGFAPLHCALVLVNQTTIENIKKVPQDKYDIGTFRNCQQVLGANPLAWGCPFVWGVDESLYDGVCWDRAGHLAGAPKSAAEDALGGTDSDAEVKVHVDGGDTLIECQAAIEPTNTHLHATGAGHAIEPNTTHLHLREGGLGCPSNMAPVYLAPMHFHAPWRPGIQQDGTFSAMAPSDMSAAPHGLTIKSPAPGYGYDQPAYLSATGVGYPVPGPTTL